MLKGNLTLPGCLQSQFKQGSLAHSRRWQYSAPFTPGPFHSSRGAPATLCSFLTSVARLTMADADKLATFQSITGADDETAQHVVESFGGDLDRAVNFFLENGEQGVATLQSFRPPAQPQAAAQPAPIDLEEDDEPVLVPSQSPDMDAAAQFAAQQEAAAEHRRNQGWLEEEAALQQALEASKVTAGAHSAQHAALEFVTTPRTFAI